MSHYFTTQGSETKSNPTRIAFRAHGHLFTCETDHGVFSRKNLDRGTKVLLDYLFVDKKYKTALDLGCGYGPIGLVLAKVYNLKVDMSDVNERAVFLAKKNLLLNKTKAKVVLSDGFEKLQNTYDLIVTNPPIRIGKERLYNLFLNASLHLNENGSFYLVINKKHGAGSAEKYLSSIFSHVNLVGRAKGFHVYRCEKSLTP